MKKMNKIWSICTVCGHPFVVGLKIRPDWMSAPNKLVIRKPIPCGCGEVEYRWVR